MTKLGRLVKAGKITSMEQIYLHSLPIKEYQIVDWFLPKLKDEVMKVHITQHPTSCRLLHSDMFREYRKMITTLTILAATDQARSEANPRRSTYSIQGHCCHW